MVTGIDKSKLSTLITVHFFGQLGNNSTPSVYVLNDVCTMTLAVTHELERNHVTLTIKLSVGL